MGHTPLLCLSYNQGSSTLYQYPELPHQQMLEDMHGLLQAAEEKRQASLAELSSKHQKVNLLRLLGFWRLRIFIFVLLHIYNICSLSFLSSPSQNIESLEAQIADSVSDRNKATETISSLQVKISFMLLQWLENPVVYWTNSHVDGLLVQLRVAYC